MPFNRGCSRTGRGGGEGRGLPVILPDGRGADLDLVAQRELRGAGSRQPPQRRVQSGKRLGQSSVQASRCRYRRPQSQSDETKRKTNGNRDVCILRAALTVRVLTQITSATWHFLPAKDVCICKLNEPKRA